MNSTKVPEPYADAVKYNPSIEVSVGKPPYRDLFMQTCSRSGFDKAFNTIHSSSFAARLRRRLWLELSKRRSQKQKQLAGITVRERRSRK